MQCTYCELKMKFHPSTNRKKHLLFKCAIFAASAHFKDPRVLADRSQLLDKLAKMRNVRASLTMAVSFSCSMRVIRMLVMCERCAQSLAVCRRCRFLIYAQETHGTADIHYRGVVVRLSKFIYCLLVLCHQICGWMHNRSDFQALQLFTNS
jgi:hypothetical protein